MRENRKENLVLANYKVESEAYQALSELKRDSANANYTVSQAMIVKRENGERDALDGFITSATTEDDTGYCNAISDDNGGIGGGDDDGGNDISRTPCNE